ncbi:ATP-binding protein [Oceanidesulfovibrio marinus]|uniref:ATP-binding protein n=1 Tax=Oceanidesulfovibrio marinus TaxID=370038 RepID=A0A6P1ZLQ2_9BACT|nr:ATP-binding protein [Oceanidesulfovibrio marinus]QJT08838.1 ATP-binding protein [Oceanidesulfovibrio marinus]TVM36736.1 ATP-binding protein [Oceanidesulfovibrio marinus]
MADDLRTFDESKQHYVLRTQASPAASRRLAKAVLTILNDAITDHDLMYNIDLSLSEACANVVRHAYAKEPFSSKQQIEIDLTLYEGRTIEIEISDWGCGFPEFPVDIKNASPEAEGGRGLFIMSELADEFELRRNGDRNSVYLKMRVEENRWNPSG